MGQKAHQTFTKFWLRIFCYSNTLREIINDLFILCVIFGINKKTIRSQVITYIN